MPQLDSLDLLFATTAFLFQIVLIAHFALRKWRFPLAAHYGPIVYALSIPASGVSLWLLLQGKGIWFILGGFVYLAWAVFGYTVEYRMGIRWRNPPRWPIWGPYVLLYLATVMLYWWPVGLLSRTLWYVYAILFLISTWLNITSHKGPQAQDEAR